MVLQGHHTVPSLLNKFASLKVNAYSNKPSKLSLSQRRIRMKKNRLRRVIQKQLVLVGSGSWFVASVPFMFKYNAHNRRI